MVQQQSRLILKECDGSYFFKYLFPFLFLTRENKYPDRFSLQQNKTIIYNNRQNNKVVLSLVVLSSRQHVMSKIN